MGGLASVLISVSVFLRPPVQFRFPSPCLVLPCLASPRLASSQSHRGSRHGRGRRASFVFYFILCCFVFCWTEKHRTPPVSAAVTTGDRRRQPRRQNEDENEDENGDGDGDRLTDRPPFRPASAFDSAPALVSSPRPGSGYDGDQDQPRGRLGFNRRSLSCPVARPGRYGRTPTTVPIQARTLPRSGPQS